MLIWDESDALPCPLFPAPFAEDDACAPESAPDEPDGVWAVLLILDESDAPFCPFAVPSAEEDASAPEPALYASFENLFMPE